MDNFKNYQINDYLLTNLFTKKGSYVVKVKKIQYTYTVDINRINKIDGISTLLVTIPKFFRILSSSDKYFSGPIIL